MLNYKVIEIFTSEEAHWHGRAVHEAVLDALRGLKLPLRCVITRGVAGAYENGETASRRIEVLSFNMPIRIEIVLPESQLQAVLPKIDEVMTDGIVAVRDLAVIAHRTRKRLLPRQIKVMDVMTRAPRSVGAATPVSEIVRMLLSSDFNAVPVVDEQGRPVGIVTQGDLISRAGMPVRLGLLGELDAKGVDDLTAGLDRKTAGDVMTEPAVTVEQDDSLTDAVDVMLGRKLKRLPVVDGQGVLTGILARVDVFRTISEQSPKWQAMASQNVQIQDVRFVRDIMRRDTHTVLAGTSLEEVMRVVDSNDLQRVAVVDDQGRLLGLVSDRELLRLFSGHQVGLWDRVASRLSFTEMGKRHKAVIEQGRKRSAGEIMKTDLVTVHEDTAIDEAIRLMTQHQIKRLPVVDAQGGFRGLVSRDSLLRAGLGRD